MRVEARERQQLIRANTIKKASGPGKKYHGNPLYPLLGRVLPPTHSTGMEHISQPSLAMDASDSQVMTSPALTLTPSGPRGYRVALYACPLTLRKSYTDSTWYDAMLMVKDESAVI